MQKIKNTKVFSQESWAAHDLFSIIKCVSFVSCFYPYTDTLFWIANKNEIFDVKAKY